MNNINFNLSNINDAKNSKTTKLLNRYKGEEYYNNEILLSSRKNDTKREQKGVFKLNFMNEELKDIQKVKKFRAKELLEMFGLKLLDKRLNKKLNHCTTEEFIERLNIFQHMEKKQEGLEQKKREEINLLK